ncbi:methylase [Permianibacter sp. IMCC34836]|uniref:SAM-dependent methyltransferase n=1 Tax=Permianibacter fluminis TaxID=2738515 RepID=UPI0015569CFA|nr:SAM-dependent methyltransferase [Permianibacter fluminis]NQD36343.1 methylase [Permianibacter fluminis]
MTAKKGELVVVGTGISFGHLTMEAKAQIERADIVLAAIPNGVMADYLLQLNPQTESLMSLYGDGRTRPQTYEAMTQRIIDEVQAGKYVCTVFYGHPGVFVTPTHEAIRRLRALGYRARMLPGISAEDCLFADLGIDPSDNGCVSYEATAFLFSRRPIDPTVTMLLWQIGIVGECTLTEYAPGPNAMRVIQNMLLTQFPPDHRLCIYEAASIPGLPTRIDWFPLADLLSIATKPYSTLLIPALCLPEFASERLAELGLSEQDLAAFSPA